MLYACVEVGWDEATDPCVCSLSNWTHTSFFLFILLCLYAWPAMRDPHHCHMRKCKARDAACNRREDEVAQINSINLSGILCRKMSLLVKYYRPLFRDGAHAFLLVAFLHHDFTGALSSPCGWFPGRRLTLAFVCALPSCHFGGSEEKVAVKATPLPSLQPHRSILKWGQMTHEPRVHHSRVSSLSCSVPPSHTFTWMVACFEGRKLLPDSHSAGTLTLWCLKKKKKKKWRNLPDCFSKNVMFELLVYLVTIKYSCCIP